MYLVHFDAVIELRRRTAITHGIKEEFVGFFPSLRVQGVRWLRFLSCHLLSTPQPTHRRC